MFRGNKIVGGDFALACLLANVDSAMKIVVSTDLA